MGSAGGRADSLIGVINMVEYVKQELVDRAVRKQERKNLKEKKISRSWVSMFIHLSDYVVEYQGEIVVMKDGWRDHVKTL